MRSFLFILLCFPCFLTANPKVMIPESAEIAVMNSDEQYQIITSKWNATFLLMLTCRCVETIWEYEVEYNKEVHKYSFTQAGMFFLSEEPMVPDTYTITLKKGDNTPCNIGLHYMEYTPEESFLLSDNETEVYHSEQATIIYYKYYVPRKTVHTVKSVWFYFSTISSKAAKGLYISTKQFPITTMASTYQWSVNPIGAKTNYSIKIDSTDDGFCDDGCLYYIAVETDVGTSYTLQPNFERDLIPLEIDKAKTTAISSFSSTYLVIDVPALTEKENVLNIDLSCVLPEPYTIDDRAAVNIFVHTPTQYINPSNTYWNSRVKSGNPIVMTITSEDPHFCSNCKYYVRLDGTPDIPYPLSATIRYSITHNIKTPNLFPDRSTHSGFHGISLSENKKMSFYIPSEEKNETSGLVDTISITLQIDEFVEEFVSLTITNKLPDETLPSKCVEHTWLFPNVSSIASFLIGRETEGFCTGVHFYIMINLTKAENRELNFVIRGHYETLIKMIKPDVAEMGNLVPYTNGLFYALNMTEIDLDVSLRFTLGIYDMTSVMLYISVTSFKDGNDTAEWTKKIEGNGGNRYIIDRYDINWKPNGLYYIRIDHTIDDSLSKVQYSLSFKIDGLKCDELPSTQPETPYKYNHLRNGYMYFSIDSTRVKSVDAYALSITTVTGNLKILYVSNDSYPLPTLGRYNYKINIPTNPFSFEITRNQLGFCEFCTLYFALLCPANQDNTFYFTGDIRGHAQTVNFTDSISDIITEDNRVAPYQFTLSNKVSHPKMVITLSKADKTPDIFITVNPKFYDPNPKTAAWTSQTLSNSDIRRNLNATIIIDDTNPAYCITCTYYMAIGSLGGEDPTPFTLALSCPSNDCESCRNPNFSPESHCADCELGYYGKDCEKTCECNHGSCKGGIDGDGSCTCAPGWKPDKCDSCQPHYYGVHCDRCTINCYGRGRCSDSVQGDGTCICDANLNSTSQCTECNRGFFGAVCPYECPGGSLEPCSNAGKCDDGWYGTGRCSCIEGRYGIDCSTNSTSTRCLTPCTKNHGYCNETSGNCVCWDGYSGALCSEVPSKSNTGAIVGGVVGAVIGIIIIVGVLFYCHRIRHAGTQVQKSFVNDV